MEIIAMASKLTPSQLASFPESKQHSLVGSLVLFLILGNLSVLFRVIAQLRIYKRVFVEDYCIFLAVICSNIVIACYLVATHHGLGLHIYRIAANDPHLPQNLVTLFKYLWLPAVFNGPYFLAIKLCLLFFYRRIFLVNQKWLRTFWWINLVYAVLWFLGSTLYYILQCLPVNYYWERLYLRFHVQGPSPIHGECRATTPAQVALPLIFSLISDIALLSIPIVTLARMQMSRRRKTALLALFLLGLLACVLELVRVVVIEVDTDDSVDPTYDTVTFIILTCAEENVAIMCACLPLIASQLRYLSEKIQSYLRSGSTNNLGMSGHGIRLRSRQNDQVGAKDQESDHSQEQLQHGSQTIIRPTNENTDSITPPDQTGVKTDLEWRPV